MRGRIGRLVAYCLVISRRFAAHRGSLSAGGLAFFVALSIAPAAVVVGGIAGLFVTPEELRATLTTAIGSAPNVTQVAGPFIDSIVNLVERSSGSTVTITSIVSLIIAVYAASRMVYGFRLSRLSRKSSQHLASQTRDSSPGLGGSTGSSSRWSSGWEPGGSSEEVPMALARCRSAP